MPFNPLKYKYDYNLGIGSEYVAYIKESHVIESRISPTPCYLLILNPEGTASGTEDYELEVTNDLVKKLKNQKTESLDTFKIIKERNKTYDDK